MSLNDLKQQWRATWQMIDTIENNSNDACLHSFQYNWAVVLVILTLDDRHNIDTLTVWICKRILKWWFNPLHKIFHKKNGCITFLCFTYQDDIITRSLQPQLSVVWILIWIRQVISESRATNVKVYTSHKLKLPYSQV
jgi:hypothetical protein